jgi:hypothetical protein
MKILSARFSNALHYIIDGWKDVFDRLGHEWVWYPPEKPAFDVFDEFEPDMFIGTTDINRATSKCIAERPEMKVVLKGRNWGPSDEYIDTEKYPIEVANAEEKGRILQLKNTLGKPDLVFNLYHKNRMEETMGGWQDNWVDTIDMQPAANHFKYFPVKPSRQLESDMSFVGGYWKYKAINFDKYFIPLCLPLGKYNIKIFGNQPWSVPQYIGRPRDSIVNDIFCSAKICPNISEPHANEFGFEVNERVFKLAATKSFCLSDHIESLTNDIFTEREMPTAKDPEEFFKLIDYYLQEPDLRKEKAEQCYNTVMSGHTYCHRVSNLLSRLNLPDEARRATELLEK